MTKKIKNHVGLSITKNSFHDDGEGVVTFSNGLAITDGSVQRNNTIYDVSSLDISEYKGQVTADHVDKLENIIAKVEGIEKKGDKVLIKKIKYAVKENPLARLAYNLLVNGFSTDFSIETYGPSPESNGVYHNHGLIGLSQVVVGNNKNANTTQFNSVIKNSIEQSKEDGLDVSQVNEIVEELKVDGVDDGDKEPKTNNASKEELENEVQELEKKIEELENEIEKLEEETEDESGEDAEEETEEIDMLEEDSDDDKKTKENNNKHKEINEMKFVTIKNSRDFPVAVVYKNAAGEEVEATLEPGKSVDVSEDQQEVVENSIAEAKAPRADVEAEISKAVNAVTEKFEQQFAELKAAFDASAQAPAFRATGSSKKETTDNAYAALNYRDRHAKQINAAYEYLKIGRIESAKVLNEINEVNLQALKDAKKVENSITIGDFGNFVISPELITEIEGVRNDYSELIGRTEWIETLSLQFAWTKRSGDINMQSVEFCDDDADGNLKPISEYGVEQVVSDLEELAAVTPVCNAATRFLAVDLLSDVARGYRTDYDRKRAQLVIARLQQAVDANPDNVVPYTASTTVEELTSWVQLWAKLAETTVNGTYVFNMGTFAAIQKAAVEAGSNGPLANVFLTGDVPTIFGRPYLIVPNDLLPTLGTGQTRTFEVDGANVTVDNAVFYFELNNFTGRASGGLQYDLSADASYEVGGVVRSAYQRNEIVLRGSFFRGGAIKNDVLVAGMSSGGTVS